MHHLSIPILPLAPIEGATSAPVSEQDGALFMLDLDGAEPHTPSYSIDFEEFSEEPEDIWFGVIQMLSPPAPQGARLSGAIEARWTESPHDPLSQEGTAPDSPKVPSHPSTSDHIFPQPAEAPALPAASPEPLIKADNIKAVDAGQPAPSAQTNTPEGRRSKEPPHPITQPTSSPKSEVIVPAVASTTSAEPFSGTAFPEQTPHLHQTTSVFRHETGENRIVRPSLPDPAMPSNPDTDETAPPLARPSEGTKRLGPNQAGDADSVLSENITDKPAANAYRPASGQPTPSPIIQDIDLFEKSLPRSQPSERGENQTNTVFVSKDIPTPFAQGKERFAKPQEDMAPLIDKAPPIRDLTTATPRPHTFTSAETPALTSTSATDTEGKPDAAKLRLGQDAKPAPELLTTPPVQTQSAAPTISAPIVEGQPPLAPPKVQAILHQIAQAATKGEGEIEITLTPEDLGTLRLTIRSTEHGHTIQVWAERADVLDTAKRHADLLQQELKNHGFAQSDLSFADRRGGGTPAAPLRTARSNSATQEVAPTPTPKQTGVLNIKV